jgi:hypothetical protein
LFYSIGDAATTGIATLAACEYRRKCTANVPIYKNGKEGGDGLEHPRTVMWNMVSFILRIVLCIRPNSSWKKKSFAQWILGVMVQAFEASVRCNCLFSVKGQEQEEQWILFPRPPPPVFPTTSRIDSLFGSLVSFVYVCNVHR